MKRKKGDKTTQSRPDISLQPRARLLLNKHVYFRHLPDLKCSTLYGKTILHPVPFSVCSVCQYLCENHILPSSVCNWSIFTHGLPAHCLLFTDGLRCTSPDSAMSFAVKEESVGATTFSQTSDGRDLSPSAEKMCQTGRHLILPCRKATLASRYDLVR